MRSSSARGRSRSIDGSASEEERVASVGDVTDDAPDRRDVDGDVLGSIRRLTTLSIDTRPSAPSSTAIDTDRRLDEVLAGPDPSEPVQRLDQPDHAVTAHAEHDRAVEEDHAGHAPSSAGSVSSAPTIASLPRGSSTIAVASRRWRAARSAARSASVVPRRGGKPSSDDPGRFAAGVRVDDVDRQRAVGQRDRVAHQNLPGEKRSMAMSGGSPHDELGDDPAGSRPEREPGHPVAGGDRDVAPAGRPDR